MNKVMKDFKYIVQDYFFELGNELSELGSNILNTLKTKKSIMILSGIILFILGCFIWRPLFLLTLTSSIMLCATFCVMLVPCIISLFIYILFHLKEGIEGRYVKYPLLNETLSLICSIIVFIFTTYVEYDLVIRDLWYHPELWNKILNL
jgi:uncharacterized membrane protein HdeD (DUF308 family)